MPNIEAIVREINKDLVPEFETKLRAYLVDQDKEWLIEQIVRLTLDAHSLEEMDRMHSRQEENRKRQERVERVKKLAVDTNKLRRFIEQHRDSSRDRLIREDLLSKDAPSKGGELIKKEHRSIRGNELLEHAKDMLFGCLFGDESTNVQFQRIRRQLLTLILPRSKAEALDFMKATTEFDARGTWQDAENRTRDVRVDNAVLEIEFGETEEQMISEGVITTLEIINNLEINEEVLYGRLERIEQSTLIS